MDATEETSPLHVLVPKGNLYLHRFSYAVCTQSLNDRMDRDASTEGTGEHTHTSILLLSPTSFCWSWWEAASGAIK